MMAKTMLTGYGRASTELLEELLEWSEWLANKSPPWAAYRGLMTQRMMALDKEPGTRPVGIGTIWSRFIGKAVLSETAAEAKTVCGLL